MSAPRLSPTHALRFLLLTFFIVLAGCGGGSNRFPVSGKITYDGKPVPAGEIVFEPDSSKSNTGPGSLTRIKGGMYATEQGLGVVGGPYLVRITPFDGISNPNSLDGKPLLPAPYEERLVFPNQGSTHDFDIPKKAGH